ncbi:MAG: hypothetical protein M3Y05_01565 [Gemmatimonadota bacterium]|nr:hypothetical protein [Gemmatimonadota bacterium]
MFLLPILVACALAYAASARRVAAQTVPPGSHVRVVPIGPALPTEGSLVAMTSDTISLHIGLSSTLVSLPMDSVRELELSHGRYASFGKVMRDGAIGLVAGAGAVLLIGHVFCGPDSKGYCGLSTALIAVPVGVGGLIGGIAIGRSQRKEQWERVYERPPSTALLIGPAPHGGFALGASISFGSAP